MSEMAPNVTITSSTAINRVRDFLTVVLNLLAGSGVSAPHYNPEVLDDRASRLMMPCDLVC